MNDTVGYLIVAKGQPVKTGRRTATTRKGVKLYRHAGVARRFARDKQNALGKKVAVLRAVVNIENPNSFDQIGFAVIGDDGHPVKTGNREPTAKLYKSRRAARVVAEARSARVTEVFI